MIIVENETRNKTTSKFSPSHHLSTYTFLTAQSAKTDLTFPIFVFQNKEGSI